MHCGTTRSAVFDFGEHIFSRYIFEWQIIDFDIIICYNVYNITIILKTRFWLDREYL